MLYLSLNFFNSDNSAALIFSLILYCLFLTVGSMYYCMRILLDDLLPALISLLSLVAYVWVHLVHIFLEPSKWLSLVSMPTLKIKMEMGNINCLEIQNCQFCTKYMVYSRVHFVFINIVVQCPNGKTPPPSPPPPSFLFLETQVYFNLQILYHFD